MKIKEFKKKYKNNVNGLINYYKKLEKLLNDNKNLNFYTNLRFEKIYKLLNDKEFIKKYKDKELFGIPFFIKDNFWISDIGYTTEAGSKILKDFEPRTNSYVVQILKDNGALFAGTTRMDELALGGTGIENEKPVINPIDPKRMVGGSSSGSAVLQYLTYINNFCSFSLGSDTGDSVRVPAAYLGLVGFKPTYGLISRRGLMPYAPSLDTVGVLGINVEDLFLISKIIFKQDKFDLTSQIPPKFESIDLPLKNNLKIGFFNAKELVDEKMYKYFNEFINFFKKNKNYNIEEISIENKIIKSLSLIYQMVSYPEAISSQANLTGIHFGSISNDKLNFKKSFNEQVIENRTNCFKDEIKRRYTLGSFYLKFDENNESYYLKAQKIRRYINDFFEKKFQEYDFIITPATFGISPTIEDIKKSKNNPNKFKITINDLLLIGNFLGSPSIVIPFFENKKEKYSLNIMSKVRNDYKLLKFATIIEKMKKVLNKNET